ncbi:hypothetical protein CEP53_001736 [Fusarium sp. AF-6]|nr:hypothetical protein CEP53_001736 [Fusarium sp. AF-6]
MHNVVEPLGPFSDPIRILPGCRPCGLAWEKCKLSLQQSDNELIISFQLAEMTWDRRLRQKNGELQCNLQELGVLRWIVEHGDGTDATIFLRDLNVVYVPQKQYPCLFPHQAGTTHNVLEILPDTTEEELREIGEVAIRDSTVLLCPAPSSCCTSSLHRGVSEEVFKLAAHWPVRQVSCAEPAEGIIDLVPVAICRNGPLHGQCVMLHKGEISIARAPMEIRKTMALDTLAGTVRWILERGRNNPGTSIHPSWTNNVASVTQPAVLQCQHRRATASPTRLYDAHDRVTTTDISSSDIKPLHYIALSYVWTEWTDDEALKDKLAEISERLGIRYFWVDRWCVNQDEEEDKAREIPRMQDYYSGASGCVVLAGPAVEPFKCVPRHDGMILSAFQEVNLNSDALISLINSKWASRIWTLQEALLSRQIVYAIKDQLIDGDYISELIAFVETFAEVIGGHEEWIGGYGCYRWNARAPSVVYPRQFRMLEESRLLTVIRTVFGGEQQHKELKQIPHGIPMPFEEALTISAGRNASTAEDYVYGLLGISESGSTLEVQYDIAWPTMMAKLQRAGMITEWQLASDTVSKLPGMSWLPSVEHGYGPFQTPGRANAYVRRPALEWSGQGAMVLGALFEWTEVDMRGLCNSSVHGGGCHAACGIIRFPDVPGLAASVTGTMHANYYDMTEKKMRGGTHVMLCRDVDNRTRSTVVMRVAGDIAGGNVYREDGYVLEIYHWHGGHPGMLKGRQWRVGSVPMP